MMRVRVIGSGLAAGYGVRRRADALDGHLAKLLAAGTGRGVTIENWASPNARLSDQILAASVSGSLELDDLIVWSPSSLEMCRTLLPQSWYSRMAELLEHLSRGQQVVVLALPQPSGSTRLTNTGSAVAHRVNASLHRAAAHYSNVTVVHPPDLSIRAVGEPEFTPDYYRLCAERVAAAVVPRTARASLSALFL